MSIRIRTVSGTRVALCAARSVEKAGDVYLDDADHHALAEKFTEDFASECCCTRRFDAVEAAVRAHEESNNANRDSWDRIYAHVTPLVGPQCGPPGSLLSPTVRDEDLPSAADMLGILAPPAKRCDHKFVDSTYCLKCGWEPPVPLTKEQADEIETELRRLECDPEVSKRQLRLYLQSLMPCGHPVSDLLTCSEPPTGCVTCGEPPAAPDVQAQFAAGWEAAVEKILSHACAIGLRPKRPDDMTVEDAVNAVLCAAAPAGEEGVGVDHHVR